MRVLASLLSLAAAKGIVTITAQSCGGPNDLGEYTGVEMHPSPLELGKEYKVVANGKVKQTIEGGKYHIVAKAHLPFGVKQTVLDTTDNVCGHTEIKMKILNIDLGVMSIDGFTCPAPAGDVTITQGGELAAFMPVKTTSVRITTMDNSGKQIQCVDMRQDVGNAAVDDAPLFKMLFEQIRNEDDNGQEMPHAESHRERFLEHLNAYEREREVESDDEMQAMLRNAYYATRNIANEAVV